MDHSLKVLTTTLPTYVRLLLQEDYNISLVCYEKKKIQQRSPKKFSVEDDKDVTEVSELELTGTPLQTDLGHDITLCNDVLQSRPTSYTFEEAQQYPLTVDDARKYINKHLRTKRPSVSIFCICDGKDKDRTVFFGTTVVTNKINRFLVYVLPCCNENDEVTKLEYMREDHLKKIRESAKIEILVTKVYDLYGYDLKNYNSLQEPEHNGNISLEIRTGQVKGGSEKKLSKVMNLQVICGHRNSPLVSFWKELCYIQSYIEQLESGHLSEATIINAENNLDYAEIASIISDFVSCLTSLKKLVNDDAALKNSRQQNVLDKLWNTLKCCRTLSVLRDCFHLFFEGLVEHQGGVESVGEEASVIDEIVNGILGGRVAVPTLSFSQSLELLIELGIEKLRKDYFYIIKNFSEIAMEPVTKKWNDIRSGSSVVQQNKFHRKTRISINPKTAIIDLRRGKLMLMFVESLHTICEFIYLCRDNLKETKTWLDPYCASVCNKFIASRVSRQPFRTFSFSFDMFSKETYFLIKNCSPTNFCVQLFSAVEPTEVLTVFHFSQHPIIPPSVFSNYEVPANDDGDENRLYVTKLVKF